MRSQSGGIQSFIEVGVEAALCEYHVHILLKLVGNFRNEVNTEM